MKKSNRLAINSLDQHKSNCQAPPKKAETLATAGGHGLIQRTLFRCKRALMVLTGRIESPPAVAQPPLATNHRPHREEPCSHEEETKREMPACHSTRHAKPLARREIATGVSKSGLSFVVYQCPSRGCGEFVAITRDLNGGVARALFRGRYFRPRRDPGQESRVTLHPRPTDWSPGAAETANAA